MVIKTDGLMDHALLNRIMLIIRPIYATQDRFTDRNIVKIQNYTLQEGFMTLAISSNSPLRVAVDVPTLVEFDLVEIPSMFNPEQITDISDVLKFGGKILAAASTGSIVFKRPGEQDIQQGCLTPPPTMQKSPAP